MKKCTFVYLPFILLMFFFNGCIFYKEKRLWCMNRYFFRLLG